MNRKGCFAKKKNPLRSFLHALFNQHATLITQYAELRRYGLSLNFTQPASSTTNNSWSACDAAKRVMEENEDLFRVTLDKVDDEHTVGDGKLSSRGRTFGANLMKYDVYHVDFISSYHTFAILLSDGKTRVFGHVRRYLPTHVDSAIRMDVGRRRPRVLIILTRAMGGEQFYSSVLK